jgi:hypothetical protein
MTPLQELGTNIGKDFPTFFLLEVSAPSVVGATVD